jgi:two-component system alkaline phosphatase synthesis response regulator PhoP
MADVLVVDDEPDVRMLVAMALEDSGLTVRQASDGPAALTSIEASVPDVVVLDVNMPGMDGHEVVRRLRATRKVAHVKVLMLTTRLGERDRREGLSHGADDYLSKPYEPAELVQRVHWLAKASDDDAAARRKAEIEKAQLLERLDSAFNARRR